MNTECLFIGVDGEKVVSSEETLRQIAIVKNFECLLQNEGKKLTWKQLGCFSVNGLKAHK